MTASRIPSPTVSTTGPRWKPRTRMGAASWGLAAGLALAALAMVVPAVTGWVVHAQFPPLHAQWRPRLGIGTAPAVLVAVAGAAWMHRAAARLPLPHLLAAAYLTGLAWMLSLAFVDGVDGVARIFDSAYEYLDTARATTDIPTTLHEYVARIPLNHPHNWPPHVAGHPPGALLFFVLLVRLGLGSGLAAGLVVTALAATTPLAVVVTLRALGQEPA
ncbi:MAG TPA: hypothetical protein VLA97_03065, partial [Nocardioidaceae bacterium]|nr:hypothetical protein [Nocardioidaceae bacterium]